MICMGFALPPARPRPTPGLLLGLLALLVPGEDADAEWKTKNRVEICFLSIQSYSWSSLVPKRDQNQNCVEE